jgi:hypothetical protein
MHIARSWTTHSGRKKISSSLGNYLQATFSGFNRPLSPSQSRSPHLLLQQLLSSFQPLPQAVILTRGCAQLPFYLPCLLLESLDLHRQQITGEALSIYIACQSSLLLGFRSLHNLRPCFPTIDSWPERREFRVYGRAPSGRDQAT